MVLVLFAIFALAFICSAICSWRHVYWILGGVLILCAAFREIGCDRDCYNYISHFNNYQNVTLLEPTFKLIAYSIQTFLGSYSRLLFVAYAIIGVSIKLVAIQRLSNLRFLSLLIYIGSYFMLHEMTQIRMGVASGILLLSLKPLLERKRKEFILLVAAATCFHYSAIIMLVFLLLDNKPHKWFSALLIPFALVVYSINIDVLNFVSLPIIGDKLQIYKNIQDITYSDLNQIDVFNAMFLLKVVLYYLMLWKYDLLEKKSKYFGLLYKIFGLSLASFLVFASLPTVAFRISELFGVVIIILYPMLYYIFSPKFLAYGVVVLLATFLLSFELFYNHLII